MASKVHRVRFYNPKPQPISCVSFNKQLKLIALARGDASIEVWDLSHAPYLLRFIPGVQDGSVEALGWVHGRLLSTGLSGALIEWDTSKLTQKRSVMLTGSAAWCLDVNSGSTQVAVGTEQGYINVYSVEYDDIVYKKLFDKQDGRVMCCKFDNAGNILVTGSVDTIRVWNVETGHAMSRLSVTRRTNEVIVWSLAVLSDNTIVSGDSYGRLTFWDSTLGEQIESYVIHKADILSITVSDDEKSIYCSGVDPVISHFVKVTKASSKQSGAQWVRSIQRHIHEHDVKALVMCDEKLVSVGVDGYLTLSSYPPKWVMRVPQMIPTPRSSVSPEKKLLLLRYSNHLEIWKLGSYATNESGDIISSNINTTQNTNLNNSQKHLEQDSSFHNEMNHGSEKQSLRLRLAENPVKLVSIQAKHKKQIQSCELSPSGELVVYSTDKNVRLLKLEADDSQTSIALSKVLINGMSSTCDRVAFTEDSRTLVVHSVGELLVLQVDPEAGATVVQTIAMDNYFKSPSVLHLLVSRKTKSNLTYIIAVDTSGAIEVFVDKKSKFVHHATLPNIKCVPSALTVDYNRETLIVAYVNQMVQEYDLVKKKFSGWPGKALPPRWYTRTAAFASVCVHPRRNAVVFQDDTSLWVLERNSLMDEDEPKAKRKSQNVKPMELTILPIKYLTGFHWVADDEAAMLEMLPENIVSQLPQPIKLNNWQES